MQEARSSHLVVVAALNHSEEEAILVWGGGGGIFRSNIQCSGLLVEGGSALRGSVLLRGYQLCGTGSSVDIGLAQVLQGENCNKI